MGKWHNCYDDSWKGIITPESFSHPAKMARGLTNRIFKHALSESWIKPGNVVVDPFGGIGSTGIIGAALGLRVVCVELEAKFVELGKQNFELNRKAFECSHFGHSYLPQIIQGDSRKLSEVIAGADCVVGSPPFQGVNIDENILHGVKVNRNTQCVRKNRPKNIGKGQKAQSLSYGQTPGQLGAMKPGSVEAIISSPPYAETAITHEGQSGNAGSPEIIVKRKRDGYGKYSVSPGNLGNLKPGEVDSIISSPPFESSDNRGGTKMPDGYFNKVGGIGTSDDVGFSDDSLANNQGDTFWAAARQIVSECHKILKPGGHAIWVVKSFVRKGAIVDFPGDWRRLCEAEGFKTVHEHHAMLVKKTKHAGLFGTITETKERKSFFRRLAEKKGSPKIDYEVVLCKRKI